MHNFNILRDIILEVNPEADVEKIRRAVEFAEKTHEGQKRNTGEPYITHPFTVTQYILQHGLADTDSICAALLHDCVEDGDVTVQDIGEQFGQTVMLLVESLTKVERSQKLKNYDAVNIKKIVLATAKDARVLIIKLCDILHNLYTIAGLREDKQRRYAKLALEVFSPIAEKIGLYHLKGDIEEKCFEILYPRIYEYLTSSIRLTREEREANTEYLIAEITALLDSNSIAHRVIGRAKYLYSIFQKMHKHNKTLDQIYDYYGIRIITETVEDCYKVHKLLCEKWDQSPGRYKDFIDNPKLNGYQSLHDNFIVDGRVVEVQLRTEEMNFYAEYGAATHWRYKKTKRDKQFDQKINHIRQVLAWKEDAKANITSAPSLFFDAFKDQIVVITPKGDPVILKEGATALDFAFELHSNVGLHARSCTVNEVMKPLTTVLKSGDIVQIITGTEPTVNSSWLQYVVTKLARSKIRQALGMQKNQGTALKKKTGDNNERQGISSVKNLEVHGVKLPIQFAQCCKPKEGDSVVAYYTKDKKRITVHKQSCSNRFMINQKQRVNVNWHTQEEKNIINISCEDKPGILVQVLDLLARLEIRVVSAESKLTKNSLIISIVCDEKIPSQKRQTIIEQLKSLSSFVSIET